MRPGARRGAVGVRTRDGGFWNPLPSPLSPEENGGLAEGAAPDAESETGNETITAELAGVSAAWHTLLPDTRTAILAIVEAAQGR